MAVAAIAYHRPYLQEHFHPNSILWSLALWGKAILFDDKVVVEHEWDKANDAPEIPVSRLTLCC